MTLFEALDLGEALFAVHQGFHIAIIEDSSRNDENNQDAVLCDIFIAPQYLDKIPKELNWQKICEIDGFPMLVAADLDINTIIDILEEVFGKFSRIVGPRPAAKAQA